MRHPLPFTGSSGESSPAAAVLWDAPTPCRPSRRASLPSLGGTTPATTFSWTGLWPLPTGRVADPTDQGFAVPVAPSGSRCGDDRVSQVPGRTPTCTCPALRPRWDRPCQARLLLRHADAAFRINHDVGSHDLKPFGAASHSLHTRCLRFAVRVAHTPRKTRFRLPATLCRAGLITRWVLNVRFLRLASGRPHRSPPYPGFAWRTIYRFGGHRQFGVYWPDYRGGWGNAGKRSERHDGGHTAQPDGGQVSSPACFAGAGGPEAANPGVWGRAPASVSPTHFLGGDPPFLALRPKAHRLAGADKPFVEGRLR